jgi:hypothetical protein
MAHDGPQEIARLMAQRSLTFPVTHFDEVVAFDETANLCHLDWTMPHEPAGVFAARGRSTCHEPETGLNVPHLGKGSEHEST